MVSERQISWTDIDLSRWRRSAKAECCGRQLILLASDAEPQATAFGALHLERIDMDPDCVLGLFPVVLMTSVHVSDGVDTILEGKRAHIPT